MNRTFATAKNFIRRNQTKILVTGLVVTTAYAALMMRNKIEFDKFITEHNLLDAYYTPDAD